MAEFANNTNQGLFTTACLPFREEIIVSLAFNLLKLRLTSAFGALNYPTKGKPRDLASSLKIIFSANSKSIWGPLPTPIDIIYSAPATTNFAVLYIVKLNCKRSSLKVWQLQKVVSLTLNSNFKQRSKLYRPTVYTLRCRFLFFLFFDSLRFLFFVTWPMTSISLSSRPGPALKKVFLWG